MDRQRGVFPQAYMWLAGMLLVSVPLLHPSETDSQTRLKTFTVPPCRVLDTRFSVPPGPIPAATTRTVRVTGSLALANQGGASDCLIPDAANSRPVLTAGTVGVYVNVVAVGGQGYGHVTVIPSEIVAPEQATTSTLNFSPGQTVANGVLVPICTRAGVFRLCMSDLTIVMGPSAAHIVIDVTGYAYFPGF